VTLRRDGELRGCIGTLVPEGDIARLVPRFVLKAALEDPRFPPLAPEELTSCRIEISLLTAPRPLSDAQEIEVGRDGLVIESRGRRGLLLPQVATEWGFDRERFLAEVARKAGLPPEAWKESETRLFAFTAEVFGEE
jgi:AmmeMemoRadiSam system protein A